MSHLDTEITEIPRKGRQHQRRRVHSRVLSAGVVINRRVFQVFLGALCVSVVHLFAVESAAALEPSDAVALKDGSALLWRATAQRIDDDRPLKKLRAVRVLVTYDRTNFYVVNGQPHGYEYELMQQFEKYLNQQLGKRTLHTRLIFVPMALQDLIPALLDGRGDIAAANLTVTAERMQQVAFSQPYLKDIQEVVVTHRKAPPLSKLEDLAGRTVLVVRGSSYAEHLRELNTRLETQGLASIGIVESEPAQEAADLFEMVNAGMVDYTVADEHVAALWKGVFRKLIVRKDLALNQEGNLAWAVRPGSAELLKMLDRFVRTNGPGHLIGNSLFNQYYRDKPPLANPRDQKLFARAAALEKHFRRCGEQYGFDWMLLMAQGFQESRLQQSKMSSAGAIGVMQVQPATGKQMGVADVTKASSNILAGVRYMDHLRATYLDGSEIAPGPRVDLTLAAYNAGPARLRQMRQRAQRMGLNPDVWFGNVERAAQATIGDETVRYVANINKYYLAYRMSQALLDERALGK
jgi:membrane-bound lytic murein transglycosylase MltF